jgi:hypothetical protein
MRATAAENEVHLKGCVSRGAESGAIVLTNAVTVTDQTAPDTAKAADTKKKVYRLSGSGLQTLLEHRVEVVGTIEPGRRDDQPSSLTTTTSPLDVVRVNTLKSLADSCS